MIEPAPAFPTDVEVAIVSYNGRATLPRVLACLEAAGAPLDQVTLVDIASTDDTASWIAGAYPSVSVIRLPTNAGPNPARNAALARAKRPFVLILDSDAYLRPTTVAALRAAMNPGAGVGMVVPVVVHDDTPDRIQYSASALHFICEAVGPWQDRPLTQRGGADEDIGTAPGLCCLIDVATVRRIGPFDERYFMGKEDGEFCYRLRLAGYRIVETPAAVVQHASRPRSTWLFQYQIRNRWHFMLKNYELKTLVAMIPALVVHEPLQLVLLAARGHAGAWFQAVGSLAAWLGQLPADRRAVRSIRTVHDGKLLEAAPLLMRADLVGGSVGGSMKRAYDNWLRAYWAVIQPLLR